MNFLKIKETCIYIQDLEGAKDFYHNKLGLEIISYLEKKHIFFRVGTSVLLCFNPDDSKLKESPPAHFAYGKQHFAFEVAQSDYENFKIKLSEFEIVITDEVTWKTGLKSFYFEDPAGNVLEILPERGIWD
jgi:catechol 2,3-dioxygenase-like lactoylglutathione lyase family enzyme